MDRIFLWTLTLAAIGCDGASGVPKAERKLRVLCGSSMATPIQEIGKEFAARQGIEIEYDLGGSETLMPKVELGVPADIFVCHDPFEEKARAAQRLCGSAVVGALRPVLAVRPGNPRGIRKLEDLARPELKLGIGDPRYSTCGELFVKALETRGLREAVCRQVVLEARAHAELASGLILGPLDAVVVWNFVVPMYPGKLETVETGVDYPETRVTVIGLTQSPHPELRDQFLAHCREPAVLAVFAKHGYGRSGTPEAAGK